MIMQSEDRINVFIDQKKKKGKSHFPTDRMVVIHRRVSNPRETGLNALPRFGNTFNQGKSGRFLLLLQVLKLLQVRRSRAFDQ